MITKQVKKSGNGAGINLPKELLGQEVFILTKEEYESQKNPEKIEAREVAEKNIGGGGSDNASELQGYSEEETMVLDKLQTEAKNRDQAKHIANCLIGKIKNPGPNDNISVSVENVQNMYMVFIQMKGW